MFPIFSIHNVYLRIGKAVESEYIMLHFAAIWELSHNGHNIDHEFFEAKYRIP